MQELKYLTFSMKLLQLEMIKNKIKRQLLNKKYIC